MPTVTSLGPWAWVPSKAWSSGHTFDAVGEAIRAEHLFCRVPHADVVMVLGPVHSDENPHFLLSAPLP